MKKILRAESHNPHKILGIHSNHDGSKTIRLWRPSYSEVWLEVHGQKVHAQKINHAGIFEAVVSSCTTYKDYKVFDSCEPQHDAYAFPSTIGELDIYLYGKGVHYKLYDMMGARLTTHHDISGVRFALWAPHAKRVSVIGDFNQWDGRVHQMRSLGSSGLWELFIPGLVEGLKYKFEIKTQKNALRVKADPYALSSEMRPNTASIISNVNRFYWTDQHWHAKKRAERNKAKPMNVYEVHLGSWKKNGDDFLNYRVLAVELSKYCKELGFTHVELLPIQEHPLDESWGYQVSGFYSVTSRFGTPDDFQWFVNHMHNEGLGVILDWVPGHFPTDDFSLGNFDGHALYEHADPRQGFHPHWNTFIFNFGRPQVSNFLIANALFWFEKMHIDGLRVDAVASMLYLDYGRNEGEWIPNCYGGRENIEAIEFLKHLNSIVHQRFPEALMIAEESTSFFKVTHPLEQGGLGFNMKWNMGWMNDTLRYFATDHLYRQYHQNNLTWGFFYAFSEKFLLVLSHDEVVHGKKSLLEKMPGDEWAKFANVRLLYSYMMCQPGKKLLFMGNELAQRIEWACKKEISWDLLKQSEHRHVHHMVKTLNHFYLAQPMLWEQDFDQGGVQWVDFSDSKNSVISYLRKGESGNLLCVHNFNNLHHPDYLISLPHLRAVQEVFNTDALVYGGSGKENNYIEKYVNVNGISNSSHF